MMANAAYRKLADNSWLQQVGNAGGFVLAKVQFNPDVIPGGAWMGYVTTNFVDWYYTPGNFSTAAAAQATLDAYIGQLNAGTA